MIYNVTVSEILKTAGVIESVFPVHYRDNYPYAIIEVLD